MKPTEPDASLTGLEWALLLPVAFSFLASGLLGVVLFVAWAAWWWHARRGSRPDAAISVRRCLPTLPQPPAREQALLTHLLSSPPPPPAPDATVRLDSSALLPFKAWVNEAMGSPHLLIAGPTKQGKTTLVRALLHFARGHL
ncbi:MAG: hypothetical protein HC893_06345, partial [Chloroflexaceae bacterium]|nr:hypothetical protein [Chloroflexaceae bacterium]